MKPYRIGEEMILALALAASSYLHEGWFPKKDRVSQAQISVFDCSKKKQRVPLWSDRDMTNPLPNPFPEDSNGNYEYFSLSPWDHVIVNFGKWDIKINNCGVWK